MEEITLHNGTSEEDVLSFNLLGMTYEKFCAVFREFEPVEATKASDNLTTDPDMIDYYIEREAKYPLKMFVVRVPFMYKLPWILTVEFTDKNIIGCWKMYFYQDNWPNAILPETTSNVLRNLFNKFYAKVDDPNSARNKTFKWRGSGFVIELSYEWKSLKSSKNFILLIAEKD